MSDNITLVAETRSVGTSIDLDIDKAPAENSLRFFSDAIDLLLSPNALTRLIRRKHEPGKIDRDKVRNILIVDPWALGDFVLTAPFFRELRKLFPSAHITLVVYSSPTLALAERCPYVDEVLLFNIVGLKQGHYRWRWCIRNWFFAKKHLLKREIDLSILPYWQADDFYTPTLIYFSGAQWRLSYSEHVTESKRHLNRNYDKFFTHLIDQREIKHEVERKLEFVKYLGATQIDDKLETWTDDSDEEFASMLANLGPQRPIVGMGIGSAIKKKRWGLEQFADLAQWLNEKYNAIVVLVGNEEDRKNGYAVVQRKPGEIVNIAGSTSLSECAAVLQRCHLYIGNDSSPKHLAAACEVPVIEIAPTPQLDMNNTPIVDDLVARFGPWKTKHRVVRPLRPRPPCDNKTADSKTNHVCSQKGAHCILNVTLEDVQKQVEDLIEEVYGGPTNFPPTKSGND